MPSIRLATWNINSIRLRINTVKHFVERHKPDILCLQETKCPNAEFPEKAVKDMGFDHMAFHGQKGYHGVATLSRLPFSEIKSRDFCAKGDTRHISTKFADDLVLHNLYVPAGGDVPDVKENDKFAHKLDFLDEMATWFKNHKSKKTNKMILVGDLNVAPLESDVWSHKQLLKVVSHTPVEVERLGNVQKAHSWVDVTRREIPEPERIYTWWSYRARDWSASNRGRRLDHIWVTPALSERARGVEVVRDARGWEKPSDHVPVLMTLDL